MRRFLKNRILKNLRLRFAAAVLLLTALLLSSCRGVELENKIVQVEGYTRPQAMILLANERNRYQDLYTPVIWEAKSADGTGFDRQLIDSVKSFAEQLKLICMMAEERNFSLSSTERDLIRQMSERYYGSLSAADRDYIGCSEEDVRTLYTDYFTAVRLIQSFTGDVSSEISDSEVKVIRIQQIATSDLKKAKAILALVKLHDADFESMASRYSEIAETELTLSRGGGDLKEKTAFSLEEGGISNILAIGDLYYIVRCVDGYDEEATRIRKQQLSTSLNSAAFQEVFGPYQKEHNIRFTERFWNEVSFLEGEDCTVQNFFDIYEEYTSR